MWFIGISGLGASAALVGGGEWPVVGSIAWAGDWFGMAGVFTRGPCCKFGSLGRRDFFRWTPVRGVVGGSRIGLGTSAIPSDAGKHGYFSRVDDCSNVGRRDGDGCGSGADSFDEHAF